MLTLFKLKRLAKKYDFLLYVWAKNAEVQHVRVLKGTLVGKSEWRKIRKQLKEAGFLSVRSQNTDPGWYCKWNHKRGKWEPIEPKDS